MLGRNDEVGVDIVERQRIGAAFDAGEWAHAAASRLSPPISSRTSVRRPVTAAAAAIAGDIRCVRAPGPWRPTKLRLEVEAQRSPGGTLSGFIARHIEQPGSRHSKPAALKILSRPS